MKCIIHWVTKSWTQQSNFHFHFLSLWTIVIIFFVYWLSIPSICYFVIINCLQLLFLQSPLHTISNEILLKLPQITSRGWLFITLKRKWELLMFEILPLLICGVTFLGMDTETDTQINGTEFWEPRNKPMHKWPINLW